MSWHAVKLGDICVDGGIQTGPFGSQLHQSDYSDEGMPVVMPVDLVDGGISTERIARVSDDHVQRLSRHILEPGDIVYARRGDVGRCSKVTQNEAGWLCGTGCLRLRADSNLVDKTFLYYALSNPAVIGWVRNHAVGATMPNLNTTILENVPLSIPDSLEVQCQISSILMAYDNLIENNRRQIALLEEAADLTFANWFITCDRSAFDIGAMSDYFDITIGKTPPRAQTECFVAKGVPWASVKDLGNATGPYITTTSECLTDEAVENYKVKVKPAGTILLSFKLTIGRVAITRRPTATNEAIAHFVTDDDAMRLYTYEYLRSFDYETLGSTSSIGKAINSKIVKAIPFSMPDRADLDQLYSQLNPLFCSMRLCQQRASLLIEARDRLLPKLMSGEIDVATIAHDVRSIPAKYAMGIAELERGE